MPFVQPLLFVAQPQLWDLPVAFPAFGVIKTLKKKKNCLLFQKIICEKVASTFQQMAGCLFIPHNIGVF